MADASKPPNAANSTGPARVTFAPQPEGTPNATGAQGTSEQPQPAAGDGNAAAPQGQEEEEEWIEVDPRKHMFLDSLLFTLNNPQAGSPPWFGYVRSKLKFYHLAIRVLLLAITACDILLCIKLGEWVTKYRSAPSPMKVNAYDVAYNDIVFWFWFSFFCALTSGVVHFGLYVLTAQWLSTFQCKKYTTIMIVEALCFMLQAFNLPNHTVWRWAITISALCLGTVLIMLCGSVVMMFQVFDTSLTKHQYWIPIRAKVDPDWELGLKLKCINDYAELLVTRNRLWEFHKKGTARMMAILGVIVIAVVWLIAYEMVRILTMEPRRLTTANINTPPSPTILRFRTVETKVVVAVLSGLMYDQITNNNDFKSFVSSLSPNALTFQMNAALPTASIPNWVTIASGVSPENSGILGDFVAYNWLQQFPFKNVFEFATEQNLVTGISGNTPWMQFLTNSTTPIYRDGTVPSWYGTWDATQKTAAAADIQRGQITTDAITSSIYSLFLVQFSNINVQGSTNGYDSSSYSGAVSQTVSLLQQIVATIANSSTILIITSDHGQDRDRGSGGYTSKMQQVPLIIYQNNSRLGVGVTFWANLTRSCPLPTAQRQQPYSLVDMAPTLAALLGLPVPWQAEGSFIEETLGLIDKADTFGSAVILHLKDLYVQKRHQTCQYIYNVLWGGDYDDCVIANDFPGCDLAATLSDAACQCGRAINELRSYYGNQRTKYLVQVWSGNFVVSMSFFFFFIFLALCYMHMYSYCDPLAIFLPAGLDHITSFAGDITYASQNENGAYINRKAFGIAVLLQLFFWFGSGITFMVAYVIVGFFYYTFDPTMWNSSSLWGTWYGICLITGAVWALFVDWLYKVYLQWDHGPNRYKSGCHENEWALNDLVYDIYKSEHIGGPLVDYSDHQVKEPKEINKFFHWFFSIEADISPSVYLVKWYMAWWTIFVMTGLIWGCCEFCAIIPMALSDPFITGGNLNWRVRIMSALCLGLPLLFFSIFNLSSWVKFSPWNARWDRVFRMKVSTDCRRLLKHRDNVDMAKIKTTDHKDTRAYLEYRGRRATRPWLALHYPAGHFPYTKERIFNPDSRPVDPPDVAPYYPVGEEEPVPAVHPLDTTSGAPIPNRSHIADKADFYDIDEYEDRLLVEASIRAQQQAVQTE